MTPGTALGWTYSEVTDGDESYWPVGSALRFWAPDDLAMIMVDFRDDDSTSNDDQHFLQLYAKECSKNDDCASHTFVDSLTLDPTATSAGWLRFDHKLPVDGDLEA